MCIFLDLNCKHYMLAWHDKIQGIHFKKKNRYEMLDMLIKIIYFINLKKNTLLILIWCFLFFMECKKTFSTIKHLLTSKKKKQRKGQWNIMLAYRKDSICIGNLRMEMATKYYHQNFIFNIDKIINGIFLSKNKFLPSIFCWKIHRVGNYWHR